MKKIAVILGAVIITLPCWAKSPILDYLLRDKDYSEDGICTITDKRGVEFSNYKRRKIFHVPYDRLLIRIGFDDVAMIKVSGKVYKLPQKSFSERPHGGHSHPSRAVYRDGDVQLILQYRVHSECPPRNADCEATWYTVDAVLNMDNQSYKLTDFRGVCGG